MDSRASSIIKDCGYPNIEVVMVHIVRNTSSLDVTIRGHLFPSRLEKLIVTARGNSGDLIDAAPSTVDGNHYLIRVIFGGLEDPRDDGPLNLITVQRGFVGCREEDTVH